jgi:hypothetical protein
MIEMMSNMESIGDMVGALAGINESIDDEAYTEALIKQAHGKASSAFDIAAAATASAGWFTHMYEYGTAGITGGQQKYSDPTSPAARLWIHTLTGQGGQQDVGWAPRPAKNRNPQPTTESTGVSSKYLAKLSRRKYIFWNKALVMETGMAVQPKSHQSHGLIFMPFNNKTPTNQANTKGYVMWNTHQHGLPKPRVPGEHVQGQFTKFWMKWWNSAGNQIIEEDMRKSVTLDYNLAVEEATARAKAEALKHPYATKVKSAYTSGKNWAKGFMKNQTAKRVM